MISTGSGNCRQVTTTPLHSSTVAAPHFTEVQQFQPKLDAEGKLQLTKLFLKAWLLKEHCFSFFWNNQGKPFSCKLPLQHAEKLKPKLGWQV